MMTPSSPQISLAFTILIVLSSLSSLGTGLCPVESERDATFLLAVAPEPPKVQTADLRILPDVGDLSLDVLALVLISIGYGVHRLKGSAQKVDSGAPSAPTLTPPLLRPAPKGLLQSLQKREEPDVTDGRSLR